MMRFIGDVHAKFEQYKKLLTNNSIQVGDMGFDYSNLNDVGLQHKFIKGNHDNHNVQDPHFLGRFGIADDLTKNIFFISGAKTIDRGGRIDGVNWFDNEELSTLEMNSAIELYSNSRSNAKLNVVVSHDCPQSTANEVFKIKDRTHTRLGLQEMFEVNPPDLWIFGHHHRNIDQIIGKTRFVCLGELQVLDID